MSSWNKLEPRNCSVEEPPHARAGSDRASRVDVASLAADRGRIRLLDGLSTEERIVVLGAATNRQLSRHTVVTNQEERANQLFLLPKGSARYFFIAPDGQKYTCSGLGAERYSEARPFCQNHRSFSLAPKLSKTAASSCGNATRYELSLHQYPKLLENGLTIANDYLTWYLASHLSLVCHTARQRLANVLVSLSSGIGRKRPEGVDLEVTNEQLANTANITLFTASRLMSEWQRSGALAKTRGRVLLRHPEQLLSA